MQPISLLCPWDSPHRNTRVGCHALLQGIFLTQGSNLVLLHLLSLATRFFTTSATCKAIYVYVACICVCVCVCVCVYAYILYLVSVMSNSLQPHGLQLTRFLCRWQFSRQEYWSGLPCTLPVDLPNSGIKLRLPTLQVNFYQLTHQWSPKMLEWVGYPFSSGSSQPRNCTRISGRFCTSELPGKFHINIHIISICIPYVYTYHIYMSENMINKG